LQYFFRCGVAHDKSAVVFVPAVLRAGAAHLVFKALDGALIHFLGCGVAGHDAIAGLAHARPVTLCPVLDSREDAPIDWLARVVGARTTVVTHRRRVVARPVHIVARVVGARVAVVTPIFAEVLSAHAFYTDTGEVVEAADRSVVHPRPVTDTGTIDASIVGAFVVVAVVAL
jgi:hypothetical protein